MPRLVELRSIRGVTYRQCSTCHEWKPMTPEHFYRSHVKYLTSPCKACKRTRDRHSAMAAAWRRLGIE